jgi:dCTP deaminase
MFAAGPVRIYPGVPICQIIYHELAGEPIEYDNKYQHNRDIQPSLLFQELAPQETADPQLPLPFGQERSHK